MSALNFFPHDFHPAPADYAISAQIVRLENWSRKDDGSNSGKISERANELGDIVALREYVSRLETHICRMAEGMEASAHMNYARGFGEAARAADDQLTEMSALALRLAQRINDLTSPPAR